MRAVILLHHLICFSSHLLFWHKFFWFSERNSLKRFNCTNEFLDPGISYHQVRKASISGIPYFYLMQRRGSRQNENNKGRSSASGTRLCRPNLEIENQISLVKMQVARQC
ncbi:hypothetical protein ZEAMMB73_Zm00001d042689 [Zea mays]|uniref:Uncharacterized protein n=1 Tax=Zea mays TaxID=4577 RepID=A0A1D6N636_MAIZE|nr:hypothetical protein ZEAMMB73_Zm00001d042689 [Zea mays]